MSELHVKILNKITRERLFKKGDKAILACSGGPDSVALLDILSRIIPLFNLKITVAYFNHGLRPRETKREKEYIAGLSEECGLRFISGKGNVKAFASKNKVSLQEAGRYLRYNFLFGLGKKLNIHKVLLGHHRDDNVETILLSFLKGAGLKGLSGIEAARARNGFLLVRPMCGISKDEISSYLSKRGLKPCIDSSNLKRTYLRNRLRLKIIPLLKRDINPRVDKAILRLNEIYSGENEYLNEVVSKNINKVIGKKGKKFCIDRKKFLKHHISIERRLLRELFDMLGIIGEGSNFRQIEILRNFISVSQPGQKLNLAKGFLVKTGYGYISIEKTPCASVREASIKGMRPVKMNVPGETQIPGLNIKIRAALRSAGTAHGRRIKPCTSPGAWPSLRDIKKAAPEKVFFDAEKVKLPLYVRTKRPGDSFKALGMKGTVKLKKYFINARVPQERRNSIPLVVSGGEIIWIAGYAVSEKVKVASNTKRILTLAFS
jgi:tRNA(Ile)-lysidine synthase